MTGKLYQCAWCAYMTDYYPDVVRHLDNDHQEKPWEMDHEQLAERWRNNK